MLGAYLLCTRSDLIMLYLLGHQLKNLNVYINSHEKHSFIYWKFPLTTSKVGGILTQILKEDTEVLINSDHDGVKKTATWIRSRKFISNCELLKFHQ